jgi:hypothetical protein
MQDANAQNIEEQYSNRKLLYENREVFYQIAEQNDTGEDAQNTEYNEINASIINGKKILSENLLKCNRLELEKKHYADLLNTSKINTFEIEHKLENLKKICQNEKIDIENMQDTVDNINYSLNYITEKLEKNLFEKYKKIEAEIITSKKILKVMSSSFNILRNLNITYVCPICLNNQVDVFLDPCGHSTCSKCAPVSKCYFCKATVAKVRKLYFLS